MGSTQVLTIDSEARLLYECFELLRLLDTEMPAQLVTTYSVYCRP
jgi:hypothetical protein